MNQTEIHGLSQWEKTDRILMEDFNADNQKIEQALTAVAASLSDLIVVGTYVGEGSASAAFGTANIDLGFQPRFLMIRDTDFKGDQAGTGWEPQNLGFAVPGYGHYAFGDTFQFAITETGFSVDSFFSYKGHVFSYVAVR